MAGFLGHCGREHHDLFISRSRSEDLLYVAPHTWIKNKIKYTALDLSSWHSKGLFTLHNKIKRDISQFTLWNLTLSVRGSTLESNVYSQILMSKFDPALTELQMYYGRRPLTWVFK